MTRSLILAGTLALVLVLTAGCGTGDGSSNAAGTAAPMTVERMETPGGMPRTALDRAAVPARIPTTFEMRVPDLTQVVGLDCQVILIADAGTPFAGGTADRALLLGRIADNGTVVGRTPVVTLCGEVSVDVRAVLILPSGMSIESNGPVATIFAPTIAENSAAPAGPFEASTAPSQFTLQGAGLGITDGTRDVTLHWTSPATIFEDGTADATTTTGMIESETELRGVFPALSFCGAPSANASLARIEFSDGGCITDVPLPPFVWQAPTVQTVDPSPLPSVTYGGTAVMTGTDLGAPGSNVTIRWQATDAAGNAIATPVFEINSSEFGPVTTTTGSVTAADRIEFTIPTLIIPGGDRIAYATIERVEIDRPGGGTACAAVQLGAPVPFVLRLGTALAPPSVEDQFKRLDGQPNFIKYQGKAPNELSVDPLVLSSVTGGAPLGADPSHIQGIVRVNGKPGQPPYLLVITSGNEDDDPNDPENQPGMIMTVRMDTRSDDGERLRSNLLVPGNGGGPWETTAPAGDHLAAIHRSAFQHLGGSQVIGDVLVVAAETPLPIGRRPDPRDDRALTQGAILFYDIRDPENIVELPYRIEFNHKMGAVGITRLQSGEYLLACGAYSPTGAQSYTTFGGDIFLGGWRVHWFASTASRLRRILKITTPADGVFAPVGNWDAIGDIFPSELRKDYLPGFAARPSPAGITGSTRDDNPQGGTPVGIGWPLQGEIKRATSTDILDTTYQNLSLITQADGSVFLIGSENSNNLSPTIIGDNVAVLYRVRSVVIPDDPMSGFGEIQDIPTVAETPGGLPTERRWSLTARVWLHQCDNTRNNTEAKRQHGNLNAGGTPYISPTGELLFYGTGYQLDNNPNGGDIVGRIAEWNHRDLYHQRPSNELPWIQLYDETEGYERSFAGVSDGDQPGCNERRRLLIEYVDRNKDDFDKFSELDSGSEPDQDDKVKSMRWFAPVGWKIILWKDNRKDADSSFKYELIGTGEVETKPFFSDTNDRFVDDDGADGGPVRQQVSAVTFERIQ